MNKSMRVKSKKIKKSPTELTQRYVNREYSWLQFNSRVLFEASRADYPLGERLKFLSIFESNLDEFFMVRVSGLIEQNDNGITELSPDGMTAKQQLELIAANAPKQRSEANRILTNEILPKLSEAGICLTQWDELDAKAKKTLTEFFRREVFTLCTPLILHPNPKLPFMSSGSLNIAIALVDQAGQSKLARIKVPDVIPRIIQIGQTKKYILVEELIIAHLDHVFPGVPIIGSWLFRLIRDADVEIKELEAADLVASIEETLKLRRFGDPVMLEVESNMPTDIRDLLLTLHDLEMCDVLKVAGLLDYKFLFDLARMLPSQHRFPSHKSYSFLENESYENLFEQIRQDDILVHHPFDSFSSVQKFVRSAADDPKVIGIKMTLYRVGAKSPIVEALMEAAEKGIQVAVMVELKARFDESNNLVWAKALERAGVHVTFGVPDVKVHCKLCLIVRKEADGVRNYVHVGTGNYNPSTAKLYTDIGLFTCDESIAEDVAELFNNLTGYGIQSKYRDLLVAPINLRDGILDRIDREIKHHKVHGKGRIIFKLNSLVDPEVIDALYEASSAGVQIDLIVRGISCVRPGLTNVSENIKVTSIVGRFLEHSRIYYFGNNDQPEAFIGSSDLMRRNLDRRIEVLTPIKSRKLVDLILKRILNLYLQDTTNCWREQADGTYTKVTPISTPTSSQAVLISRPLTKDQNPSIAK